MKVRSVVLIVLVAAGTTLLLAANFWDTQPYTEWTDKQIQKMLEDSPWARSTPVQVRGSSGGGGMRGGMPFFQGPGGGGGGGGFGGVSIPNLGQPTTAIVRWQTALPIRQVLALQRWADEAGTSEEAKQYLARELPNHVVGIFGVPMGGAPAETGPLAAGAQIVVKSQPLLTAAQAQVEQQGRRTDIYFAFPKQSPDGRAITLDDKEIEVVINTEALKLKRKFNLKDMVYQGKLEL